MPIDLRKIKTPSFLLSTREDHIAPWRSTYAATQIYRGPVKFVLSASGHIAGVVNPPGGKYGHWENDKNPPTPEEWLATATTHPDSWWPLWERWISQYAGGEVPARHPGDGKLKPIENAPALMSRCAPRTDYGDCAAIRRRPFRRHAGGAVATPASSSPRREP